MIKFYMTTINDLFGTIFGKYDYYYYYDDEELFLSGCILLLNNAKYLLIETILMKLIL